MLQSTPHKARIILLFIILLALGSVIATFIGYRILGNQPATLLNSLQTKATLALADLHQTATRDGKPEWTLDAQSAQFIQEEKKAVLENLTVVFFMDNQEKAHLSAEHGTLDNTTNNFMVNGDVQLKNSEFTLYTEELQYNHQGKTLYTGKPVSIKGKSLTLSAETAKYDLNTHQALLEGRVKGIIRGPIQF